MNENERNRMARENRHARAVRRVDDLIASRIGRVADVESADGDVSVTLPLYVWEELLREDDR